MIKTLAPLALTAAAAFAFAMPTAAQETGGADTEADTEQTEGQIELAKLLEGRVAGEPQNCIRLFPVRNFRVIDDTALVYDSGNTIYVNIPRNPEDLDDSDRIVTRSQGTRLCRSQPVTTFERFSDIYTGNIFLGEFVPYKRADS